MEVRKTNMTIEGIKITSPSKILFEDSDITKEDVVRYYASVSKRMLPFVEKRIVSAVRCPRGVDQPCFFKKHPQQKGKGIVIADIPNSEGKMDEYFYIESAAGLVFEAQMGTLEIHTWGSKVDTLEKPDIMVFDLDPDEGMAVDQIRQGVRDLKSILDQLHLKSYLKTSGGKGYHVVVPFQPSVSWEVFYGFSKRVAEVMEKKWPDRYTSNIRKVNRANKIFIDWQRNGRGATSIAPYSLRARAGGKVSMPISWRELNKVAPNDIDMENALERLKKTDPWKDFFSHNQLLQ